MNENSILYSRPNFYEIGARKGTIMGRGLLAVGKLAIQSREAMEAFRADLNRLNDLAPTPGKEKEAFAFSNEVLSGYSGVPRVAPSSRTL